MKGIKAFLIFLFIIPIGHIVTGFALKFPVGGQVVVILIALFVATVIMYATKYLSSETWETFWGLIAGVLLWASLFEMGFRLGIKQFSFNETKAVELTLVLLVPLLLYFFFIENCMCTFFLNLRRLLHPERQVAKTFQVDRWGARTALKVFFTMWTGHVVLFYTYDVNIFGERGFFAKFLFAFCLFNGSYLFYRLLKAREMGFAFRYAIPTVVIIWSCVETQGRWKKYPDPLAVLDPFFITCVAIALSLLASIIIRAERRDRAAIQK